MPERRGFALGLLAGAIGALSIGWLAATVPDSPTWALWSMKRALDVHDVATVNRMVDWSAVVMSAAGDLQHDGIDGLEGALGKKGDLGQLALGLLQGDRIRTVFDDPDRPVRLDTRNFVSAWWHMERNGDLARFRLPVGDQQVTLSMRRERDGEWRIVGLSPLGALLRVKKRKTDPVPGDPVRWLGPRPLPARGPYRPPAST